MSNGNNALRRAVPHLLVAAALAGIGWLAEYLYQRLVRPSEPRSWVLPAVVVVIYLVAVLTSHRRHVPTTRVVAGLSALVAGLLAFVLIVDRSGVVAVIALVVAAAGAMVATFHGRTVTSRRQE